MVCMLFFYGRVLPVFAPVFHNQLDYELFPLAQHFRGGPLGLWYFFPSVSNVIILPVQEVIPGISRAGQVGSYVTPFLYSLWLHPNPGEDLGLIKHRWALF